MNDSTLDFRILGFRKRILMILNMIIFMRTTNHIKKLISMKNTIIRIQKINIFIT